MQCHVIQLGTLPYSKAVELQDQLVDLRWKDAIEDVLFLLEHPPVLTVGRTGGFDQLKVPVEHLTGQGVEVLPTNRGGNITYHGPGQVVGYPILNLHYLRKDAHWYLRSLENVLIETLKRLGIEARRIKGRTGVWVLNEKIASIGVAIRHWVTMHGFALNVHPDLSHFSWINPCGYSDAVMTSIQRIQTQTNPTSEEPQLFNASVVKQEVLTTLIDEFGRQFDRDMVLRSWDKFQADLEQSGAVGALE